MALCNCSISLGASETLSLNCSVAASLIMEAASLSWAETDGVDVPLGDLREDVYSYSISTQAGGATKDFLGPH